jgi:hypothetical protein
MKGNKKHIYFKQIKSLIDYSHTTSFLFKCLYVTNTLAYQYCYFIIECAHTTSFSVKYLNCDKHTSLLRSTTMKRKHIFSSNSEISNMVWYYNFLPTRTFEFQLTSWFNFWKFEERASLLRNILHYHNK